MALAMFSWGIAWTNAKIVNEYLSFHNLIFLRFLIGSISIYPNPTDGLVTISFTSKKQDNFKVRIVNLLGERIFKESLKYL